MTLFGPLATCAAGIGLIILPRLSALAGAPTSFDDAIRAGVAEWALTGLGGATLLIGVIWLAVRLVERE